MTLHLYDTATRAAREFVPLRAGEVGLYVCGATVQGQPHIGHMRKSVAFDVLVRWLRRAGYRVTFVQNVTDIDDKILARSAEAGEPWWAWAQLHERQFAEAERALGILAPTYEPRATGHVPDMVDLMERLVARGHAYAAGEGNVYFDVRSFADYGSLTNQRPDDLPPSADEVDGVPGAGGPGIGGVPGADEPSGDAVPGKRDPRDFALWKATKPGDPETASWATPFGRGRPGWHLECSAMARRYLGEEFDIHGGGLDLRFPHHENEQAQSRAAGYGFARHWMHSAWVTQGGAKMSKSLGNGLVVSTVLASHRPVVLRYALTAVQYRSMLEYTPETLREAEATWNRLAGFVTRATEVVGLVDDQEIATTALPEDFTAAMDDDLNVPAALAVVHEHLRAGNTALADGAAEQVRAELVAVRGMLDVLGLDPGQWESDESASRAEAALDALVRAELDARAQARAAKDWATADAVRNRLTAAGVVVEDSPTGARWSLAQNDDED